MRFITSHKEIFEMFDLNKDGIISFWEIHQVINDHGKPMTEEEVTDLLLDIDSDGTGEIDLDKVLEKVFMEADVDEHEEQKSLDEALKTEEMLLEETFKVFDHEKRNSITLSDFKYVITNLDMDLSDMAMEEVLKEADETGTGRVEYHTFLTMMKTR